MEQKFISAFKEAMEREDEVKITDVFREYDEWDSLAYLEVIAMLDEDFGVEIEADDFKKLITVEDIIKEIEKRRE